MAIYRGPGGPGDATQDAASEVLLALQAKDAAVAAQVAAEAAQAAAETAETNAETAETNAETAETNAETAATNAASSASSASSSASSASTSATNAASSASSASTSATNAANSATAASTSASNASTSASSAATSATNASTSASAAATSATNASNSASAAATSATNASNSASAASTSATNAANSATAAQTAQTAAELAETNAELAETNAETAATNAASSASAASTSASNAATSETNASNSASAAATSATNASNSASAASTSATNASNSASAAATSASNAATSETNAASSASAASTSASNAASSATSASNSASAAATSETNAASSASAASTSATNASNSASSASTSATNASNSASAASTSASNAASSATAAQSAQSAAETARDQTLTAYDNFDDRYLGAKSSAPSVDNDGNTLLVGALYFNTATNEMKVWDGSAWLNAYASLSGALLATNNLSDLNNTATARTNLGVTIGVNVQAYDAQLADIAGLTPSDNNFIVGNGTNFVTESGSTARTSLGLGSIATQESSSVSITGGSISGITDLAVADGGTGSSTASGARTNLGLAIGTDVQAYNANLQGASQGGINGMKNRIINGAMVIDQRNAGASVTCNNNQAYAVDRFYAEDNSDGVFTVQQVDDAPAGFLKSLKATITTADSSLAGTQFAALCQQIEGNNFVDFGFGSANAQALTLSFWVKSSLTGTFGGTFRNSSDARCYPFTYTISSANTWEQKTITVAGDTTGTWVTNNGIGIKVWFSLGAGSTYSGTAGSWQSSLLVSATGAVSVIGTLNATFQITGVQLEKGSTATSFDYRPYGTELALCQRYYEKSYDLNTVPGTADVAGCAYTISTSWNTAYFNNVFKVTKRTTPTFTAYSTNNGATGVASINNTSTNVAINAGNSIGTNGYSFYISNNGNYGAFAHWTASAEL